MTALDVLVRLAIRAQPVFRFARWCLPSAYGCLTGLCALSRWWAGALLCAVFAAAAWLAADIGLKGCRELESMERRQARREAWAAKWEQGEGGSAGVER